MKINLVQDMLVFEENNVKIQVDVAQIKMDAAQRKILESMSSGETVSQGDLDAVKDLKAYIGGGAGPEAGIVRFDWKWVSID